MMIRDLYSELADDDEDVRLQAAHALLNSLSFAGTSTDYEYAIKRLTRGLASGRKSSRIGFSVALTELISQIFGMRQDGIISRLITFERLIELLKTSMKPEGNVSGQEIRDHHLGTLFGLEAIVKSGILYRPASLTIYDIHHARAREVLDLILELGKQKPWLSEECGFILYDSINEAYTAGTVGNSGYAQVVIEKVSAHGLAETPDGVAIWLRTKALYPGIEFPANTWHNRDPLDAKNRSMLARAMKNGCVPEAEQDEVPKPKKGFWSARLHFAWDTLLSWYFTSSYMTDLDTNISNFKSLWKDLVDDNLFAAAVSDERKSWGFLVLGKAVSDAPGPFLRSIFSQNLMRCLINQLSDPERYLHASAQKSLRAVFARAERDSDAGLEIVRAFLSENGTPSFDQITKTKTIDKLLQLAGGQNAGPLVALYQELIGRPGAEDAKTATVRRQLLVDQLLSLLRRQREQAGEVAIPLLNMLSTVGYFTNKDPSSAPSPPFSEASVNLFRARMLTAFTILLGNKADEKAASYPYLVLRDMRKREKYQGDKYSFALELDNEIEAARSNAWRAIKRIHKKEKLGSDGITARLGALNLLYCLVHFQLYDGDADSLAVLEELNLFYKNLYRKKIGAREDAGDASVVLVELLISLVAKPSKLLRAATQLVFSSYAGDIGAEGLAVLIKVLATEENLRGQQSLFDEESSGEESSGDEEQMADADEVGDHDSDTVVASTDIRSDMVAVPEAESSGGAQDSALEEPGEEILADITLAAIKIALSSGKEKGSKLDGDASSDDAADMDDEQMMALDPYLNKVFEEKGKVEGRKAQGKEAKETVVGLKNRVLDFLDIYLKQQSGNGLSLTLLVPLLQLMRQTSSKQVGERAAGLVREVSKHSKVVSMSAEPGRGGDWVGGYGGVSGFLYQTLEAVHAEAMVGRTKAHGNACSQASLVLVKLYGTKAAVELYAATWSEWHSRWPNTRLHAGFFSDFIHYRTGMLNGGEEREG
ncbi:MAG: DNA-directed DNA polymerase [Trizodia sp. TS-e1964]|nr:MAG: DNA-directed DNA polymerase [Trizodia sp. TS-e1964]